MAGPSCDLPRLVGIITYQTGFFPPLTQHAVAADAERTVRIQFSTDMGGGERALGESDGGPEDGEGAFERAPLGGADHPGDRSRVRDERSVRVCTLMPALYLPTHC